MRHYIEQEAEAKEQAEAQARTDALNPGRWWSNPAGEAAAEDRKKAAAEGGGLFGLGGGAVQVVPGLTIAP